MAHIQLPDNLPGILGPLTAYRRDRKTSGRSGSNLDARAVVFDRCRTGIDCNLRFGRQSTSGSTRGPGAPGGGGARSSATPSARKGASFKARVFGGNGHQLQIVKDGATVATVPVTSDDFIYRFEGKGPGRWRLQVMRGA